MNESDVLQSIQQSFDNVFVQEAAGDFYVFCDDPSAAEQDRRFPFVTLVTGDRHDKASNLHRPGVYRLNIGISPEVYRGRFGEPPPFSTDGTIPDIGFDFTATDQLMPHPVYAAMFWVCVLNPTETTFRELAPLLRDAYEIAAARNARRAGR